MNEKFEDKLIRLAFDETGTKESAALELQAQADPEAARLLTEYRSVHIGLNLLTDVPPDQLSKERLRDAILGQGLKPLPPQPSRWGWAWMPATACALAFGWMSVRHLNTPEPKIVQTSAGTVAMSKTPTLDFASKPVEHVAAKTTVASFKKTETPQVHKAVPSVPDDRVTNDDLLAYLPTQPTKTPQATTVVAMKKPPVSTPPASDTPGANPGKLASINSPMVVINPENDNSSGAQKATEVDGASNVVVGG